MVMSFIDCRKVCVRFTIGWIRFELHVYPIKMTLNVQTELTIVILISGTVPGASETGLRWCVYLTNLLTCCLSTV